MSKKQIAELLKALQELESKAASLYQNIIFKTDNENVRNVSMEISDDIERHTKMISVIMKSLK